MVVAVDIGNSAVKLALVIDGRVGRVERLPTSAPPEPLELAERLAELALDGPVGAGIAAVSVVPAWSDLLREAAGIIGTPVLHADAATIPLAVRVALPGRVGTDRLIDAWSARETYGAPVLVVDLGTATTVDAVGPDGTFAGGAILPGLGLSLDALARGTAQLPRVEAAPPRRAVGKDTAGAIRSGVVLGHLGAIRELVARMSAEIAPGDRRPPVVVTGGFAAASWADDAFLSPAGRDLPPIADVVDPELTLRGLDALAGHLAGET